MDDLDWMASAICRGQTDLFFPDKEDGDNHGADGKALCRGCLVRTQCLIFGVATNQEFGIWGGAGGDVLRWLRRAWRNRTGPENPYSGATTCPWAQAAARHFADLDGEQPVASSPTISQCNRCGHRVPPGVTVVDRNGPGARCGKPVTYARGCRCEPCMYAAALRARRASVS